MKVLQFGLWHVGGGTKIYKMLHDLPSYLEEFFPVGRWLLAILSASLASSLAIGIEQINFFREQLRKADFLKKILP